MLLWLVGGVSSNTQCPQPWQPLTLVNRWQSSVEADWSKHFESKRTDRQIGTKRWRGDRTGGFTRDVRIQVRRLSHPTSFFVNHSQRAGPEPRSRAFHASALHTLCLKAVQFQHKKVYFKRGVQSGFCHQRGGSVTNRPKKKQKRQRTSTIWLLQWMLLSSVESRAVCWSGWKAPTRGGPSVLTLDVDVHLKWDTVQFNSALSSGPLLQKPSVFPSSFTASLPLFFHVFYFPLSSSCASFLPLSLLSFLLFTVSFLSPKCKPLYI